MVEDLEPDLDRFIGPFRRRWRSLGLLFVFLSFALTVGFGRLLDSGMHEATLVITADSNSTSLELAAVLPGSLSPLNAPPTVADLLTYFDQKDLSDDLGLPNDMTLTVSTGGASQVVAAVIGPSFSATSETLEALVAGFESHRVMELEVARDAAIDGLTRLLAVSDSELAALEAVPSALEQRSALARGRVQLLAAQELLESFPGEEAIGVDFDIVDPVTAVPSSNVAAGALGLTAATIALAGVGVLIGLLDHKVRTRNDLSRVAPGGEVVGLIGDAEDAGAVAVAQGLISRELSGEILVVGTHSGVADLAASIESELLRCGAECSLCPFETPEEFEQALRAAAAAAAVLLVIDWGSSDRLVTSLRFAQLRFAGSDRIGLVLRGVPEADIEGVFC